MDESSYSQDGTFLPKSAHVFAHVEYFLRIRMDTSTFIRVGRLGLAQYSAKVCNK